MESALQNAVQNLIRSSTTGVTLTRLNRLLRPMQRAGAQVLLDAVLALDARAAM
jgi:hypothetical protein